MTTFKINTQTLPVEFCSRVEFYFHKICVVDLGSLFTTFHITNFGVKTIPAKYFSISPITCHYFATIQLISGAQICKFIKKSLEILLNRSGGMVNNYFHFPSAQTHYICFLLEWPLTELSH